MDQRQTQYFIDGIPVERTDSRVKERTSKFLREFIALVNIFSPEQKEHMIAVLNNNTDINFCSNYIPLRRNALSDVRQIGYTSNGIRNMISLSDKATPFITKHECAHAGLLPKRLYEYNDRGTILISGHGCQAFTKRSFEEFKRTEGSAQLYGCGEPLEEGLANILASLATIKEKAKTDEDFREADLYMATGNAGKALNGIFRGYFVPLEDITRLFMLASRNDYMQTHPFSEVLASPEGIDGNIDAPVNKPYCSFISSATKGDFEFQYEFDTRIYEYNQRENASLQYYTDICGWISRTQMRSILQENTITDMEGWKRIIKTLQIFYSEKMSHCVEEGFITDKRKAELLTEFNKSCESVERKFEERIAEGR